MSLRGREDAITIQRTLVTSICRTIAGGVHQSWRRNNSRGTEMGHSFVLMLSRGSVIKVTWRRTIVLLM